MTPVGLMDWFRRLLGRGRTRPVRRQLQTEFELKAFAPWPEGGHLVGGAVRDALLGQETADLDWLVAQPERAASLAARLLDGAHFALDEQRGYWRVVTGGHIRDYLALRGTLEDDLKRRDFTVNTLALSASGEIIDVCGGLADLQAGVLRMTGEEQLRSDPLRLLRGVRLATVHQLELEAVTAETITALAGELATGELPLPAWERSRAELDQILLSDGAPRGLRLLDELGLLEPFLPELSACRGVDQGGMHHADVLGHHIDTVAQLLHFFPDADLSLRWAALLHDVGKPATRTVDEGELGRIRFHGHERVGADIARQLLMRLRHPSARVERVAQLVRRHMQPLPQDEKATRRFIHRYGELLPDLLRLMIADREATRGRLSTEAGRNRYRLAVGRVLEQLDSVPPEPEPPLLSGAELMELLGLEPGPRVGQAVRYLAELQAVGDAQTVEQAKEHLLEYAQVQWPDLRDEVEPG